MPEIHNRQQHPDHERFFPLSQLRHRPTSAIQDDNDLALLLNRRSAECPTKASTDSGDRFLGGGAHWTPTAASTTSPSPLPPQRTPLEKWLLGFFCFALFSNFTLDIVGNFFPIGEVTKEKLDTLSYPPYAIRTAWWFWVTEVDPILRINKAFMWAICAYSPFFMAPFYACGIYCILNRKSWIQAPGLFWAGLLISTLVPEMAEYAVESDGLRWPNAWSLLAFLVAYSSYIVIPGAMVFYFGRYPLRPSSKRDTMPAERWMHFPRGHAVSTPTPLRSRPLDLALVCAMGFATLLCLTVPYYTLLSPLGKPITEASVERLVWPPQFVAKAFHEYSVRADPLWHSNPTWAYWYALFMAAYPLVFLPLMYALVREQQWLQFLWYEEHANIRQLGLVWAGWHTSCVGVCLVGTLWHAAQLHLTSTMSTLTPYAVALPQVALIILMCVRLAPPHVFAQPPSAVSEKEKGAAVAGH